MGTFELTPEQELELDQIFEEARARKEDPYSYSELEDWLKMDSWLVREGLLLMSGILPTDISINLDDGDK